MLSLLIFGFSTNFSITRNSRKRKNTSVYCLMQLLHGTHTHTLAHKFIQQVSNMIKRALELFACTWLAAALRCCCQPCTHLIGWLRFLYLLMSQLHSYTHTLTFLRAFHVNRRHRRIECLVIWFALLLHLYCKLFLSKRNGVSSAYEMPL